MRLMSDDMRLMSEFQPTLRITQVEKFQDRENKGLKSL